MKALYLISAALAGLCFTLSACGGGGDVQSAGNVPVAAPAPPPAPTPPPPATAAPLLQAVQTGSPSAVLAAGVAPTLRAPGSALVLPLLITAVDASFFGDQTTTSQGAKLTVASDGTQSLTINNPAWNVNNTPTGAHLSGVSVVSGPFFAILDLDYTSFGGWYAQTAKTSDYAGGGEWLGGLQTPVGAMPVSGSASYVGNVNGQYSGSVFGIVGGNVAMTANFGTGAISGRMTNLLVADTTGYNDPLNDILFSASIGGASNRFVGTTSVSGPPRTPSGVGTPSGLVGLGLNASGTIVGGFFGPTAQEAGAVWTIDGGGARVIGSFGAKTGN